MPRLRLIKSASFVQSINRAAWLLLAIVVLVNVYRRIYLDAADPYKCAALLTHGHWLDSPDRNPELRPFQNWRVPGCLIHEYTVPELASCNENGQFLFVGDTGTRQVFWAAARKIEGKSMWVSDRQAELTNHGDLEYSKGGANLKFIWDPWLNSTTLKEELRLFGELNTLQLSNKGEDSRRIEDSVAKSNGSALIFAGGGLWHARHLGDEYLTHFKQSVDAVAAAPSSTNSVLNKSKAYENFENGNRIFFAPVFEPLYDRLSPSREAVITPQKVQAMNEYLGYQSSLGLKVPWIYYNVTKNWPELVGASGMHVDSRVAGRMADVVLNFRCNAKLAMKDSHMANKTCCTAYRRLDWIQIFAAVLLLPGLGLLRIRRHTLTDVPRVGGLHRLPISLTVSRPTSTLKAMYMLISVIWYCFVADRTHIFEKSPKEFTNIDFRVLLGLAVVGCLPNIKKIPTSQIKCGSQIMAARLPRHHFLPREQTDEFKGGMQIYVLAYGYTGASHVLDFYEVFRIFIACYLFLLGYGHTIFFLQKKDYSFQRVVSVLLRLNMLPVLLAFAMDKLYASYTFIPLASFWFMVVYITLMVGSRFNKNLWCVIGKLLISALLITGFIHVNGIIEHTCEVLHLVFQAKFDGNEWQSLLSMDKYAAFVGMLVAILRIRLNLILDTPRRSRCSAIRAIRFYTLFHIFTLAFALVALPSFWILTRRSPNKTDYDWWMPYTAWLPVVSLLILRNTTHFLRSHYCASFAWLGRISLELYLLSNHIWLAGDSEGLLQVGFRNGHRGLFRDRWRILIFLTPIMVWLAWKVHDGTERIIAWIQCTEHTEQQVSLGDQSLGNHGEQPPPNRDNLLSAPIVQPTIVQQNLDTNLGSFAGWKWRLVLVMTAIWLANAVKT
ncbi:10 TM acyl transferase domain found in Cas1p-domain-containing protein [Pyrenochaeta sp. MPI-SDFR-AT-0127]|nr:10 TM acyl transferase domain found in Cas1p-domain-containing protein [Pyrenochaeta sp. MPI-SDFR-AT-0127]